MEKFRLIRSIVSNLVNISLIIFSSKEALMDGNLLIATYLLTLSILGILVEKESQ